MRVQRFVAVDMRTALQNVRTELGAEAVILSNRKVNGLVEILAARDYDEALINEALTDVRNQKNPDSAAAYYENAARQAITSDGQEEETVTIKNPFNQTGGNRVAAATSRHTSAGATSAMAMTPTMSVPFDPGISQMREELKSLRAMLESQHALSEWGIMAKQYPLRVSLYRRLTELGLSQDVCKYLSKGLDERHGDIEQALQAALKQLMHQLPVMEDKILDQGGICALVGPTGVGKTTTIAKIAARFAMRHGQRHVALISTDNYRIGAHEQLQTYGRLLGVPVHVAASTQELQVLLHKLHDKKLILIDTAGMSQRDMRLSEQFAVMGAHKSVVKSYLVLSANTQLAVLDEAITAFKQTSLAGCILTKLDETASLGGVFSALIRHHLPLAWVSNGQRVPEDLQPARARELIDQALVHLKRHRQPSDDEFLAVAFSNTVGHAQI
ncbi:MAG TPA: flagellar biosynthesis protein FlhF [Gammaproteobacteria bacterium]|nr:flagellar biosynthesis protein FlhF [Gammaproteobacteria bacterium]